MKPPTEFRSRKEQIEKDFMAQLVKDLKDAGVTLSRRARKLIKTELRAAAMVGAAEERHRTLNLLKRYNASSVIETAITSQSVLTVLGYED